MMDQQLELDLGGIAALCLAFVYLLASISILIAAIRRFIKSRFLRKSLEPIPVPLAVQYDYEAFVSGELGPVDSYLNALFLKFMAHERHIEKAIKCMRIRESTNDEFGLVEDYLENWKSDHSCKEGRYEILKEHFDRKGGRNISSYKTIVKKNLDRFVLLTKRARKTYNDWL